MRPHRLALALLPLLFVLLFVPSIARAALPPGIDLVVEDDRTPAEVTYAHPNSWDASMNIFVNREEASGSVYYGTLRRVEADGHVFVHYDITRLARAGDLRLVFQRDHLAKLSSTLSAALQAKFNELSAQFPDRVRGRVEVPRGQRTLVAQGMWTDGVHYSFAADVL